MCAVDARKWYQDLRTGKPYSPSKMKSLQPGKLLLMHSEISESYEGFRKGLKDEHLPEFDNHDIELADLLIRLFDYCGTYGIDLERAFWAKRQYNAVRPDHKPENRRKRGGKKF